MEKARLFNLIGTELRKAGATSVAVFGSYARGDQKKDSDIDVLVEFGARKSLLDIVGIEQELSKKTKTKIDLVTVGALSPHIRDSVNKNKVVIC